MGRWSRVSSLLHQISKSLNPNPNPAKPLFSSLTYSTRLFNLRTFSAVPSRVSIDTQEFDSGSPYFAQNYAFGPKEDEETGKIPVKAYFLSTRFSTLNFVL